MDIHYLTTELEQLELEDLSEQAKHIIGMSIILNELQRRHEPGYIAQQDTLANVSTSEPYRLISAEQWYSNQSNRLWLHKTLKYHVRSKKHLSFGEALSEAYEKLPLILAKYDPLNNKGASLRTWISSQLRWYLLKTYSSYHRRTKQLDDIAPSERVVSTTHYTHNEFENIETAEWLDILRSLDKRHAIILELRFIQGLTFEQIALLMHSSTSVAHSEVANAVFAAKVHIRSLR